MTAHKTDIAVVGLGAFGSSALWQLAMRGIDVTGIEQFKAGHDRGSTHGASRVFRVACMEHPALAPLAQRAGELWRELEQAQGCELLRITGALMIGPPNGRIVEGAVEAAETFGLPIERLTAAEVRERFPLHASVPDEYAAVWDPGAGAVKPEEGVVAAVSEARKHGATVFEHTGVESIEALGERGYRICTAAGEIHARKVIVAAGPWLGKLFPELPLTPRRTPMMWFTPPGDLEAETTHGLEDFPVFIRQVDDEVSLWGHGAIWGHGVKIGLEDRGPEFDDCDPDTVDRGISPSRDWRQLSEVVTRAVRGLDPIPERAITCMITNTPDMQFLLGELDGRPGLIVAGGCSGHGFKHATAVGEHLAELALGQLPTVELDFTDPNRFAR